MGKEILKIKTDKLICPHCKGKGWIAKDAFVRYNGYWSLEPERKCPVCGGFGDIIPSENNTKAVL